MYFIFFRYFLGSTDSTFSFRIQEEREILGFPTEKTFEILCPEGKVKPDCHILFLHAFNALLCVFELLTLVCLNKPKLLYIKHSWNPKIVAIVDSWSSILGL